MNFHLIMNYSVVLKYLNYVHVYEYVDDNVQHEEMVVKEMLEDHFHLDLNLFHLEFVLHLYHVNIEHLILVINQDQVKNL